MESHKISSFLSQYWSKHASQKKLNWHYWINSLIIWVNLLVTIQNEGLLILTWCLEMTWLICVRIKWNISTKWKIPNIFNTLNHIIMRIIITIRIIFYLCICILKIWFSTLELAMELVYKYNYAYSLFYDTKLDTFSQSKVKLI